MAFIRINRKLFDNPIWKENRVYSRAEAWIDLIQLVSYTPNNKRIIDGVMVMWGRGEYPVSHRFLSLRWNWSINKTRAFMQFLSINKQSTTRITGKTTILKLCQYDYYNPTSQGEGQDEGQGDGKVTAQSIRIEEDKEDKEKEKEIFIFEKRKKEEEEYQKKQDDWNRRMEAGEFESKE
jgi:hypothetical protein